MESRNAPNGVPLPDIREYRPSSVSMIEPMMNAIPARKNSLATTRPAAARLSAKPVSEIAFGVSRDSIKRLRISS